MAWWLTYEELYGNMDKEYPIMNKNDDDVVILGGTDEGNVAGEDSIDFNQGWWEGLMSAWTYPFAWRYCKGSTALEMYLITFSISPESGTSFCL